MGASSPHVQTPPGRNPSDPGAGHPSTPRRSFSRASRAVSLFSGLLGLVYGIAGAPLAATVLFSNAAVNAALPWLSHVVRNPRTVGRVALAANLLSSLALLTVTGGMLGPSLPWLLLLPCIGFAFADLCAARISAIYTILGVGLLWAAEAWGMHPMPLPGGPLETGLAFSTWLVAAALALTLTRIGMDHLQAVQRGRARAEERLQRILQGVDDAFFLATPGPNDVVMLTPANAAAAKLIEHLDLGGHDLLGFLGVGEATPEGLLELQERTREAPLRLRDPSDGGWWELEVSPLEDGFVLQLRDATERIQTEGELKRATQEALEASRLKTEFLATMSHEIRTPLNGILGMIELALDTPPGEEQRAAIVTVHQCAEHLLQLVNDILDLSKIEAGRMEVENVAFDLHLLLDGVQDALAPKAMEKQLDWNAFARPQVPSGLEGDPLRLRQVLLNLAGNAMKFTEEGEVVVEVQLAEAKGDEARLRFEVRDTGPGIPPEKLEKLFEKFTQADASTTRTHGGTGLGLTISKELVELMGGRMEVESEVGKGSCFAFELPLRVTGSAASSVPTSDVLAGRRALVVDDLETNRRVLAGQLRRLGCRYTVAGSAKEGLEEFRRALACGDPYDFVISDHHMPEHSGLDLGRWIREAEGDHSTGLLLLSSYKDRESLEQARQAGFDLHMSKPVKMGQLRHRLLEVLGASPEGESGETGLTLRDTLLPETTSVPSDGGPEGPKPRVLLAEDNPVNRKVATRLLEKLGLEVESAENGCEAVERVLGGHYDLVLMDCQMPEMDGFEATRRIRAAGRASTDLPIVALTANAMSGDRERCLAAGMDEYLTKPLRRERLVEVLGKWLTIGVA